MGWDKDRLIGQKRKINNDDDYDDNCNRIECTKPVMHKIIAYHLLINAQPMTD